MCFITCITINIYWTMNETFKHCVNSVFELYMYLLVSLRYPYHTLPPPFLSMEDHCKLWWRGGSQNPNRKVSSQPRICGGKAGSNQENLLLEEHEYFWSNTEIIIKYPTHSFNHLVRLHQPGCFPRARGEIELQCSVTGKMLAGYNRFDHNHIECKQKLLVEIFGT